MDSFPRYSRQMILPSVGAGGQNKLSNSTVAVIGAGGIIAVNTLFHFTYFLIIKT